jgi:hypothetical protein
LFLPASNGICPWYFTCAILYEELIEYGKRSSATTITKAMNTQIIKSTWALMLLVLES